jgi:hypothetical protein
MISVSTILHWHDSLAISTTLVPEKGYENNTKKEILKLAEGAGR